jgi:Zn-dependent peptidase ImmA (M78 family)
VNLGGKREGQKSEDDYRLIERTAQRIAGFNERSLNLLDLRALCGVAGIEIVRISFEYLHGYPLYEEGVPYLFINRNLNRSERIIAGFHEFCHFMEHGVFVSRLLSTGNIKNLSRLERQAQIVGTVSLMPAPLIIGMTVEDLMRRFEIRREIAEFRASLRF